MNKKIKAVLIVIVIIGGLLVSLVAPIDHTPLIDQPFYNRMMNKLDSFRLNSFQAKEQIKVGWSQFSIVPDSPEPMAGYKPRKKFTDVHDSVYMRIMAISNGSITAYIITADLLLFPPSLQESITKQLGSSAFVYFSATHTHTSVGGWDSSLLGRILMGEYNGDWVEDVANKTIQHMELASASMPPAELSYWEVDASKYVVNRIDDKAPIDGKFRGVRVERSDSTKAMLFVFGAHATMINKHYTSLSGDYPAEIIKNLHHEYDFAQFMAGSVGSQRFKGFDGTYDFTLTQKVGKLFSSLITNATQEVMPEEMVISTGRLKLEYGVSQLRLVGNVKLRDWVFKAVNEPLQGEITILKIGDLLMLGTPCDFSGEIVKRQNFDGLAANDDMKLIITSFNGNYTGYITDDTHYLKEDDEELHILNWVGPHFGQYFTELIESLIEKAKD